MNAITREQFLKVSEVEASGNGLFVLLGRDIRISHEVIADYCITQRRPIYEDLAVLVESMAYMDRLVTRHRSKGWSRELAIELPVYELELFRRKEVVEALTDSAWFLTGDFWRFDFVQRQGPVTSQQVPLPLSLSGIEHVVPFSDGLDSFAQARNSIKEHGQNAVLLVRAGLGKDRGFPGQLSLRVPRRFSGHLREVSYRTRPLIFFTLSAIAAHVTGASAVAIGENGQGSLGAACLPFADEWWFRSTHPVFIARWANVVSLILGVPIRFEQPNVWKTKGEVLAELRRQDLIEGWHSTTSCSTRSTDRFGYKACGVCGGCLLRIVSALSAGLEIPVGYFAFDVRGLSDTVRDRGGRLIDMPPCHRHVAVRAITAMEDFAKLLDSPLGHSTVRREARLIDDRSPEQVEKSLVRLVQQHRSEWDSFKSSVPTGSWFHEIVEQL